MPEPVQIKGTPKGLLVMLNSQDFALLKASLIEKMEKAKGFFKGAKYTIMYNDDISLTNAEKEELEAICNRYGLIAESFSLPMSKTGELLKNIATSLETVEGEECEIVLKNFRSGQTYFSNKSLLILGDVNPGAEIISHGNIIVWGSLRGIAHAGYPNNEKAQVIAINLVPAQIRIGKFVTRAQENPGNRPYPEKARVEDGQVIIEKY
ncbi:septum site-determining protein MinC [Carboxydothermus hydrogenoformans]|uniref:Probable septum site-determining protein MinC n=1 Tax=Carboxydothermus hydrogenoformans (strain ATCC BAA-161 / DSM 6008 / Z-2901) TaxID=246194 RepID=Q3AC97_CARHZ|nr:septum site-determining protein MinC [Carboxydothermus hydrogenoformans]ABB15533.1 septum site-determining protein MinC [Carboxydothermus hydrogenoformans Z-2901]